MVNQFLVLARYDQFVDAAQSRTNRRMNVHEQKGVNLLSAGARSCSALRPRAFAQCSRGVESIEPDRDDRAATVWRTCAQLADFSLPPLSTLPL